MKKTKNVVLQALANYLYYVSTIVPASSDAQQHVAFCGLLNRITIAVVGVRQYESDDIPPTFYARFFGGVFAVTLEGEWNDTTYQIVSITVQS